MSEWLMNLPKCATCTKRGSVLAIAVPLSGLSVATPSTDKEPLLFSADI
jgi:hypothetical protein